ncbi:MAG: hypothetical protein ABIE42_05720 [Candidatus Eisenbacteria bacterium]
MKLKTLLWLLGAAGGLNLIADLWFRTSVSAATSAPWWVWAPVVGTIVLVLVTVGGSGLLKRLQSPPQDESEGECVDREEPWTPPIAVKFYHNSPTPQEGIEAAGIDRLRRETGHPLWRMACGPTTALETNGHWVHTVSFFRVEDTRPL